AAATLVPLCADFLRDDERLVGPFDRLARGSHFVRSQRFAVSRRGSLLVRSTPADDSPATQERRTLRFRARSAEGGGARIRIVPVAIDDLPAVGLETLCRVVPEPTVHSAVDGDAVVVVTDDELPEAQGTRERARLVRDAFHQAPVTCERVGVMIDDVEPRPIELCGEQLLRERHADGIRQSLTQRPGRGLDPQLRIVLWVSCRARTELPEVLDL